ncbi:hypothetical protein ALC53_08607 [Atta colombica]|uniref:Uncharacterized protein n=1 Tax=Atta colombica TaxID=520822 RepID=A0A151I282_9HYME|nr:hypothetical protein ALC53_08607 [Atta colombica]
MTHFFFAVKTNTTINILQSTHYINLHQLELTLSVNGLYTFKIQFFGHLVENHEDSFFKNVFTENTVSK